MLSVVEGFESYGSANSSTLRTELRAKWPAPTMGSSDGSLIDGVSFGKALQWANDETAYSINFPLKNFSTTFVMGFSYKHQGTDSSGAQPIVEFISGASTEAGLEIDYMGSLFAYRGSSTLLAEGSERLRLGTWSHVEILFVLDNSTGVFQVRVNGQNVINETNVDTKSAGSTISSIRIWSHEYAAWDDIYIYDDLGGAPSLQGSHVIESLFPTADDTSQWTPSTGSDHYALVNDTTINDTTYVSHDTINEVDDWGYGNLTEIDGGILGLAQFTRMSTNTGGVRVVNSLCESNSTEDLDSIAISEGFNTVYRIVDEDPDTSIPWTAGGINAATFGVEVGD